jgi:hypothetical protein
MKHNTAIELDNRLGSIISRDGSTRLSPASVDDDNIALYVVSAETDPSIRYTNLNTDSNAADQVIEGARSTYLEFRIASSIDLRQSNFLVYATRLVLPPSPEIGQLVQ